MTYKKLYEDALFKLEHNKITLGEFEEMIKPLEREVEQEPILDKITELIEPLRHLSIDQMSDIEWLILRVIDKYQAETEG